jgi:hypothetical protein
MRKNRIKQLDRCSASPDAEVRETEKSQDSANLPTDTTWSRNASTGLRVSGSSAKCDDHAEGRQGKQQSTTNTEEGPSRKQQAKTGTTMKTIALYASVSSVRTTKGTSNHSKPNSGA